MSKKVWCWMVMFVFTAVIMRGQDRSFPVAVKSFGDAYSMNANPAASGETDRLLAAFSMSKPLGVPGLSKAGISVVYPFARSSITAEFRRLGSSGFSDSRISLGAGKKLGKISIGAGINYRVLAYRGYLPEKSLLLEAGAVLWINERCYASLLVYDITGRNKRKNQFGQTVSMSGAMGWQFSEQAFGGISWNKEGGEGMSVQTLIIYFPLKNISLRTGYIAGKQTMYFSSRYKWGSIQPEFKLDYHQQLGFTPSIRFYYEKE